MASSATASERSLALPEAAGGTQPQPQLGPGLTEGMGEAGLVAALNPWACSSSHLTLPTNYTV